MNTVSYEFKRAHWSMITKALREFRRLWKEEGVVALRYMTPARYDILHIIAEHWWWTRQPGRRPMPDTFVPVGDIIELLGLHPSTVSKTLTRMETRKLIVKRRDPDDERYLQVKMTKKGWEALRAARRVMSERPQNFLRVELARWFTELGMPNTFRSMRTAQNWGKTLASCMGLESARIHDPRCDLGRARACRGLEVFDRRTLKWRLPPPPVRRRSYGSA